MALQTVTFEVLPIVRNHFIINCVLVLLTLIVVGLRIAARFAAGSSLWWDDYFIILSVPQGIAMLAIQGLYLPMGVGYNIAETLPNLEVILQLMVAYAIIYTFCIGFVKLSVLCFYLRVFVGDKFRIAVYATIGLVSVWSAANVLLLFLICRPFASNYDLTVPGVCGDRPTAFIAIGAFNIISDILILLLPIPTIWSLRAQKKMKIGLTIIFSFGFVVAGVAVGRIFTLEALDLNNITETMVWVDFLSTTEINLGILCVSVPMLKPIFRRIMGRNGASKLSATPDPKNPYERSSKSRSKASKQAVDETIGLDTMYAPDWDVNHDATVLAHKDRRDNSSQDGSEVSITRSAEQPKEVPAGKHERGMSIRVQKQWDVRRA
jgi:hypothetical protein